MKLTYYRCCDCLSTMTSTEKPIMCACDGILMTMGQVYGKHFGVVEEKCACDDRCTHASGPSCGCICSGANHGTGKTIQVLTINGLVRVKEVDAEAYVRAKEWREALNAANERFIELHTKEAIDKYTRHEPMRWETRMAIRMGFQALEKITKLKVHKMRMDKINGLFIKKPESRVA